MTTLEEAFEQFKQLPDWQLYPMPDVFYKHFNLKKPKPSVSLMEALTYTPPPHQSLNTNGKVEIRKPVEGGVRPIEQFLELPVEQFLIKDESETCMLTDSAQETLNHPTEDSSSEILPGWDHQSVNPFYAAPDSVHDVPCRDAECNPASQPPQNESS